MSVSHNGFNENVLTFIASGNIQPGIPVKISDNNTVSPCTPADSFCGVCCGVRNGFASVQLSGIVSLPFSSAAPAPGYRLLASDGTGGIKSVATGGRSLLVVSSDSTAGTVTIML